MNEMLKFEVQRIDGTTDSVIRAVNLIIDAIKEKPGVGIGISTIDCFFEEFHVCVLDRMLGGKPEDQEELKSMYKQINAIISGEHELCSPYTGIGHMHRFGAMLKAVMEIIEIYLRRHITNKDRGRILSTGKEGERLRKLVDFVHESNKIWLPKEDIDHYAKTYYFGNQGLIFQDLKILEEMLIVMEGDGGYRIFPSIFYWLKEIKDLQN